MIRLSHNDWWELTEAIFDDSTGPIDDPGIQVEIIDQDWIGLHFDTPANETLFALRWIK